MSTFVDLEKEVSVWLTWRLCCCCTLRPTRSETKRAESPETCPLVKEVLKAGPLTGRESLPAYPSYEQVLPDASVDRLERLLRSMRSEAGADPEMVELNKTLEKLMGVQRPTGILDSSVRREVFSVVPNVDAPAVAGSGVGSNRWYGLDGDREAVDTGHVGMIETVVPESQTLVDGGVLKLEVRTTVGIKGVRLPAGTIVYGEAHLRNERLQVKVSSVRSGDVVYPVALRVVDLDGLAGIYEPGSAGRDAVRESAGQGVSMIGPTSLDGGLGGQAANVGIQMARSLAGRKVRQMRVTVPAGYRVFLEDMSKKF